MSERNYDATLETITSVFESGLLDVVVSVRRRSDGFYLDWSDDTFKSSGWTIKNTPMTEVGITGQYERQLNLGNVLNLVQNDIYVITVSSVTSSLSPQVGEIKCGDWVQNLDAPISQAALETTAQNIKEQTDKMNFDRDGNIYALVDFTPILALLGVNRRIKNVVHDADGNLVSATVCGYANASDAQDDINPTITIAVTGEAALGFQSGLLEVES